MFNPLHQHVIFKLRSISPVINPNIAKMFLYHLVNAIGMVPVTEPQVVMVSDPGNEGLTGSINLATSHIAFHCWDTTGLLMLDVYSCKCFDVATVLAVIDKYWNLDPVSSKFSVIDRADDSIYKCNI